MKAIKKALKKLVKMKPEAKGKPAKAAAPAAKSGKPAKAAGAAAAKSKAPAPKAAPAKVVAVKGKAPAKVAPEKPAKVAAEKPVVVKGKAPKAAAPVEAPVEKVAAPEAKLAKKGKVAKAPAPKEAEKSAGTLKIDIKAPPPPADDEPILTDAEGRRYCRIKDCDQIAVVDTYCRYHYLLLWKNIQVRKKILSEGKLDKYIEELTARYPDKYLEMLRKDLKTEKDFTSAIQELELDESNAEGEFEEETFIDEVRGMSPETAIRDEEEAF